jgi:hypothetical protein
MRNPNNMMNRDAFNMGNMPTINVGEATNTANLFGDNKSTGGGSSSGSSSGGASSSSSGAVNSTVFSNEISALSSINEIVKNIYNLLSNGLRTVVGKPTTKT